MTVQERISKRRHQVAPTHAVAGPFAAATAAACIIPIARSGNTTFQEG